MTGDADEPRTGGALASRRRFLGATVTGALAGAGMAATGARASGRAQSTQRIELGGEIAGWRGRSAGIAGETNPTLNLETGETYRVTWTNLDGFGHNFALLDGNRNVVERTSVMSEKGATQTLEFTARETMAEYICEPHSGSMRGAISFGTNTETRTPTATPTSGGDPVPQGPTVALREVAGGLEVPTDFAVPPGDDRRFVVDLPGQVYAIEDDGRENEPFIDVADRLSELTAERGLLGIAFHPDFAANRRFFLRYSAPLADGAPEAYSHTEVLSEFTASDDGTTAKPDSERVLLEVNEPREVHNGGAVTFGPDGYLYLSFGDGGSPRDMGTGHAEDWYARNGGGNGQDVTENLLGAILRIDVDSREDGKPYAIPDDNPLVGKPGLDEHYAWGFRNPWRMGFSRGKLFVADVGQNRYEEVNRVVKGGNYGWNVREGTHCYGTDSATEFPERCPDSTPPDVRGGEPLRDPIIEYPHSRDGDPVGLSVIGGYRYEGDIDALDGKYVFGDYSKQGEPRGSLFAATPTENGRWSMEELQIEGAESGAVEGYLISIGRDETGELYALTSAGELGGSVYKLTAPQKSGQNATAERTQAETSAATRTQSATAKTGTRTGQRTGVSTATVPSERTESEASTASAESSSASEAGGGRSDGDGPGFGVLAALSGIAALAARRLARR